MISWILKRPWWVYVIAGFVVLLIVNQVSGSIYSRKLWNMVADQIRVDQSRAIETLEKTVTEREMEIASYQEQLKANQKKLVIVQKENDQLRGKILEIQTKRENIIVSSDPDRIVDELRALGIGSAQRITSP